MNEPTRPSPPDPVPHAASQAGDASPFGALPGDEMRRNPLQAMWRRKWIIVVCAILGMIGGYVFYLITPPVYEGRARILVSQSGPKLVQQDFPGTLSSGAMWLNTQCELIRSPAILSGVVKQAAKDLRSFREDPELAKNALGRLVAATFAAPGQRNEIITVAVRWPDPSDAATLANAIVAEYEAFNDELKKKSASEVARILRDASEKNARDLQTKYAERQKFQRDNAGLSFNREVRNPVLERVNAISSYLTSAELEAVKLQAEYDTIASVVNDPQRVRQLLMNPQYRNQDAWAMRRELRDMQIAIEGLSGTYGTGSDRFAAQLQRMERTKAEFEAEEKASAQAILQEVGRRLEAARQQIDTYRKWYNQEQAQVLSVNTKQADFELIEADIRRMERYSDQLSDQLKSINLAESAGAMNVYVVESAKENRIPVLPDRLRSLFYGAIVGMLAGMGLAALRELTDTRMRSAEDIKRVLTLPILGVVPHIQRGRTVADRGTVVQHDPMSDTAEAYRTVRTAVYFGAGGTGVRTLLITSPAPGDGKTTLASNLALAMAQAGNRVILLDCDFRKPTQHRVFELDKRHGLSNVLAGEMTIEQVVQNTKTGGLSVIPCGPIPANPSEILNGQGFADLLEELSRQYDTVLIDSPPVLPVTDSRILAASCDAVILAVRAEKTTRPAAMQAREHVTSVGGRLLGVVVNDVPRRKGVYSYYYADEGRYGYYGPRRLAAAGARGNGSTRGGNGAAAVAHADQTSPS